MQIKSKFLHQEPGRLRAASPLLSERPQRDLPRAAPTWLQTWPEKQREKDDFIPWSSCPNHHAWPFQYGDTPLHTSARYGHAGVIRILVSGRCNVSEQNKVRQSWDQGIIEKSAGNNKYPGPGTPAGAGAQLGPNSFRHSARFLTGLAGAGRALHWAAHVLISHCNYLRAATTLHSPSRDPTPGEIKGWPNISYLLSHSHYLIFLNHPGSCFEY